MTTTTDARRVEGARLSGGPVVQLAGSVGLLGGLTLRTVTLDAPGRLARARRPRPPWAGELDPADPPWCPPGGASWIIHSDPAGLIGGFLSLWVQALHPGALAGVMDHSNFAEDPLGRLERTGGFVSATTFAPGSAAGAMCEQVRRVHRVVRGTTPAGEPYSADDPALLDWIHCALVVSIARAWLLYGDRPDPSILDAYVDEQARVPIELGDPDPPRSWQQLIDRLEEHRPHLEINEQTEWIGRWLAWPTLPGLARAGLPVYRVLYRAAVAAAPGWARQVWGVRTPRLPGMVGGRVMTRGMRGLLGPSDAAPPAAAG